MSFCKAQNIYTYVGTGIYGNTGDGGSAILADIGCPRGITFDRYGNLYIAIGGSMIRKVNTSGIISTIAGSLVSGYSGDGGPAISAQLDNPFGIAVDTSGNIYFTENFGYRIRKINSAGIISTIAGNGIAGYSGDGGLATAALINNPRGIGLDDSGNVYFTDFGNHLIRKISKLGIITTIAGIGSPGYTGDGGQAVLAKLNGPNGLFIDKLNNIYFTDSYNYRVRKINTSGIINSIAGNGLNGYSGNGVPANSSSLSGPIAVTVDSIGMVYVSEQLSPRIRMIDNSGLINTIGGTGIPGNSGDGGLATLAQFSYPYGLAEYGGNIYFGDCANHKVRVICGNNCVMAIDEFENGKITEFYPNPTSDFVTIKSINIMRKIVLTTITGQLLLSETANDDNHVLQLQNYADGIYFLKVFYDNGMSVTKKILVNH
jgi:hypothetical protein